MEKNLSEIKYFIRDMAKSVLDAMQIKGMARIMINNQLNNYIDDDYNNTDLELAYYTLLKKLKDYGFDIKNNR